MKSNKIVASFLLGMLASISYFCVIIALYYTVNVLHVFPVFAGEDDFSIRRLIVFYTLIPSVVLFGFFLRGKEKFKASIIGMFVSSILYGLVIYFLKKYLIVIDDRDIANLGVFLYFFSFILFNILGLFLSRKIMANNRSAL